MNFEMYSELTKKQRYISTFLQTISALKGKKDGEFIFGIDENNEILTKNIEDCGNILVSGCVNSGKSVFLKTIIASILYGSTHTNLILIDTKQREFIPFKDCPQLICPIIMTTNDAITKINNLCKIIDERYAKLKSMGSQNSQSYIFNKIICIIDEIGDLMIHNKKQVEPLLVKIAKQGSGCGVYLIVATQRPSVDIIPKSIKETFSTLMAFSMINAKDSILLIGKSGAEKLLGNGDYLVKFAEQNIARIQASNICKEDIEHILKNL